MKNSIVSIMLLLTLCSSARIWTSKEGIQIKADLVMVSGSEATIRLTDGGQEITIPVESLIPKDREFIDGWKPAPDPKTAPNYDDPWPDMVSLEDFPEINIVEEDVEKKRFVYRSPHYEYVCDVRLNKSLVSRFSRLFEVTFESMKVLPMNFEKARKFKDSKRMRIELFEKKADYVRNGGPPSSAGVYIGGRNVVMVPLTSLGVRPLGKGYIIDRDASNKTLVHELVHQLTDHVYYAHGARGWFTEGLAEYVANSPYSTSGRIRFKGNTKFIVEYATGFSRKFGRGRNLGEEITLPSLKEYLLQPYSSFAGANANYNYGVGMILFTWFVHMDDDGSRKNFNAFLKAMRERKSGMELVEVMKAGRSWAELKKDITSAWKRKGIKIKFGEDDEY